MGWIEKMKEDKAKRMCDAWGDLCAWIGKHPELKPWDETLMKFTEIHCVRPENANEMVTHTEKDGTTRDMTAAEWFNMTRPGRYKFPKKGFALVWLPEIALAQIPQEVMAKARELLEQHEIEDVWWDILKVYFDKKEEE